MKVDLDIDESIDDMDIYSEKIVEDRLDNGQISEEEAAFMRGYNAS